MISTTVPIGLPDPIDKVRDHVGRSSGPEQDVMTDR